MFESINRTIAHFLGKHPGANAGIFSVSYGFMQKLNSGKLGRMKLTRVLRRLGKKVFQEERGGSKENALLLRDFKSTKNSVLLGVLGGRNSEGEDFPGKEMELVLVVGLPFAPWNDYIKRKMGFFEREFGAQGRDFGYVEPAIMKANQAAGRPIRKEQDEGTIVLMDYRYLEPGNRKYLSKWYTQDGVLEIIEYEDI